MRLIDADELYLGKFVEPRTEWNQGWNAALDTATTQAPTVDAVEVVRCKDCRKWHDPYECPMFALEAGDYTTADGSGFCDYGEREDNA